MKVEEKPLKHVRVLSLGAGVQSSTMALMAAHGEIERPDYIIFSDTGWEPKRVYDWLHGWLIPKLAEFGMEVIIARRTVDGVPISIKEDMEDAANGGASGSLPSRTSFLGQMATRAWGGGNARVNTR